jgi:tRNA G18 (ribose-2'-O)-methylase SpoU
MKKNIFFVLDNIRSAFNVGSIFRTADGLGYKVHLIGITPLPGKDKKLEKTSLNAIDHIEWEYFTDYEKWFERISIQKENIILSVEETKRYITTDLFDLKKDQISMSQNIYIFLGHEINGVNEIILDKSDLIVKLPMSGFKNSLNVATCAGIIGYKIKELIQ